MDMFGKVGDTVAVKAKEAAGKARILAEIAGLKGQIAACREVIKKNYMEIGKQYFEEYGDVPEAPYGKNCRAIADAQNGVEKLQARIDELKGL